MNFKITDKIIFIAVAVLLLSAGQLVMFSGGNFITGIVLSFIAITAVALVLFGGYETARDKLLSLVKNIVNKVDIKKLAVFEERPAVKEINTADNKDKVKTIPGKPVKKLFTAPEKEVSFKINKNWLYLIAGIVFAMAQLMFLRQKWGITIAFLFIAAILIGYILFKKNKLIEIAFTIPELRQSIMLVSGLAFMLIGWIMLVKGLHSIKNLGVFFTSIGVILSFLGLPESKMESEGADNTGLQLFSGIKFLMNPFVKIGFAGAAYGLYAAGNMLVRNNDLGLYSLVFYGMAAGLLFFALPVIETKEKENGSLFFDILRLAAILGAIYLAYVGQTHFTQNRIEKAVMWYFIAAALVVVFFPATVKKQEEQEISRKWEYAFVAFITAVGIFLRVYEINARPFGLENDEASAIIQVLKNFWVGQHPIFAYVWELCFSIFGANRIGLRMSGALVGIISVPVLYFAVRSFLGARTSMFATVLFAFLRWNVHYGRSGHGAVFSPIAEALAIYFIFMAIQKRDKNSYFMAGVTTGFCWTGLMTGWLVVLAPVGHMIMEAVSKPKFIRKNMIGILAFFIGFWLFTSPHIKNYFISDKIYFSRISEVSVFSKDPNAPVVNPAVGIIENTRRVMLMFNHQGDSRQRNSGGMPYEPAVDFATAMLFGLGFLYCLYYSKNSFYFILLLMFFSQAAGSIFSIEAPSAMRAVGTMVPVVFFAAVIFSKLWKAISAVFKRTRLKDILILPLVLLFTLFPIVKENYRQVFQRWVGGLDELTTAAGMYSEKLGKDYRIFLYTNLYWTGHPPFRIFRWDYKVEASKEAIDSFRALTRVEDENFAIFLHYDIWQTRYFWQQFFPEAKFDIYTHEGFGKLLEVLMIKNEEIQAIRGLKETRTYAAGINETVVNSMPDFEEAKTAKLPYRSSWSGSIFAPYYGSYTFFNKGTAKINVNVNGVDVSGKKEIRLGKGFNNIRIEANRNSAADTLKPAMNVARYYGSNVVSREVFDIKKGDLYTFKSFGLRTTYYSGQDWGNSPVNYEEILPLAFFNSVLTNESQSMKLSGYYTVKTGGEYKFAVTAGGFVAMVIDGRYYWDNVNNQTFNKVIYRPGMQKVQSFPLSAGRHKIEFYTQKSSGLVVQVSVNGAEMGNINYGELEPELKN